MHLQHVSRNTAKVSRTMYIWFLEPLAKINT